MFNPSKWRRPVSHTSFAASRMTEIALIAAVLVMLLSPWLNSATAGVDPEERKNAFDSAPKTAAPAKAPLYQVRCWQNGRLLFEENEIQLPPDLAAAGLKLRGTDRSKRPVYLADTQNATCWVRAASPK